MSISQFAKTILVWSKQGGALDLGSEAEQVLRQAAATK